MSERGRGKGEEKGESRGGATSGLRPEKKAERWVRSSAVMKPELSRAGEAPRSFLGARPRFLAQKTSRGVG